ncbi:hypothetical protein STW0522KLE44_23150 [Klebsiella sp. STW0522-44]|nr:hypothetical protein STW0522KLE44_23150 [Klebsiella sp. STW0522-44]
MNSGPGVFHVQMFKNRVDIQPDLLWIINAPFITQRLSVSTNINKTRTNRPSMTYLMSKDIVTRI